MASASRAGYAIPYAASSASSSRTAVSSRSRTSRTPSEHLMSCSTPSPGRWSQAVWKRHEVKGPGGFRVDRYCFRILKLGEFGDGDAWAHRWRRSDATGAATAQPGGLRRWGEPGSGDRGLHRRTGPGRLGIFRGDAGGDWPAGLPPLDAAEDLPLWLPQPRAVESAAGTRSAA